MRRWLSVLISNALNDSLLLFISHEEKKNFATNLLTFEFVNEIEIEIEMLLLFKWTLFNMSFLFSG